MPAIRSIENKLAETNPVCFRNSCLSRQSFTSNFPYEKIIRQYIYKNYIKNIFFKIIFFTLKREKELIYPLPLNWINILENNNIKVNHLRSRILWYLSLVSLILINISRSILYLLKVHRFISPPQDNIKYVYFSQLTHKNIPPISCASDSFTIIDWYLNWNGKSEAKSLRHNLRIRKFEYKSYSISQGTLPYFIIGNMATYLKLLLWLSYYIFHASYDFICGKWWSLLLIYDLLLAKSCSLCPSTSLAEDYLFHYSGLIYRPLWTYVVENRGSRVITYFYSSYQNPSLAYCDNHDSASWPASTWSHHLVWDSYQREHLERNLENRPILETVGSIWFSDSINNPIVPEKSIAIFPIEFARIFFFMPISTYGDLLYKHPNYLELFIDDILDILMEHGYTMVLKLKRDRPRNEQFSRNRFIFDKLRKSTNVLFVDSDISPLKIFSQCKATISMPFTSTAHYKEITIPNIYYDPTTWFDPDDSAAHGIPLISKKICLRQWLRSNVFDK